MKEPTLHRLDGTDNEQIRRLMHLGFSREHAVDAVLEIRNNGIGGTLKLPTSGGNIGKIQVLPWTLLTIIRTEVGVTIGIPLDKMKER